jgi:hypothetical protein
MKKLILFAILAIAFASCKKSNSGSPVNTITATINDTVYTFNNKFLDTTIAEASDSEIGVEMTAQDLNLNTITLIIADRNAIPLKTTTYGSTGDTVRLAGMGFASLLSNYSNLSDPPGSNPLTITVNSITSTSIQGTFKGTIFLNGDTTSADKKTVTNGTFSFTKPVTTFTL